MINSDIEFKFDPTSNYITVGFIVICLTCHESINNIFKKFSSKFGIENKEFEESDTKTVNYAPIIFFMIPVVYLMLNDYLLKGDNWEMGMGITKVIPERLYNYILRIAGAYGLIQVLAQDLGIKTGLNQRNFIQLPIVQFMVLFGSAYSFTGFRGEAMFGTLIYLLLKYNSSFNKLSGVCFEDV
jgi:hypothetical protein